MSLAQHMTIDVRRVIVERQKLMKNTGANFKDAQQKMHVGQFAAIAVNAQSMALNARRLLMLFPPGSVETADTPSRAKVEIWQDWQRFSTTAQEAQKAAVALMDLTTDVTREVTQEQVLAALKVLGDTCKSCHKQFRKPRERK
jgi:cytochrome c556